MKVGDRVMHALDGDIGNIEEVEDWGEGFPRYAVRWRTPLDEPSVLTTFGIRGENLLAVPDSVKPQARSGEWMAEARAFCEAIAEAIKDLPEEGESDGVHG